MKTIVPVASGKGGVGKSFLTANLGIAVARAGKTVVLVDLDLGGSNLHTLLGIRNRNAGIGHFIHGHNASIEELVVPTGVNGLFFIPGDALYAGTANLPYYRKQALIKQLHALPADFIFLDLGAGSAYNTLDFFIASPAGILVTIPETTAVLNAYSFVKAALFRLLYRSFPARSDERAAVADFMHQRLEGGEITLSDTVSTIASISPASAEKARRLLASLRLRVVLNMGRSPGDVAYGANLRNVIRKNLGTEMEFLAFLPYDPVAQRAAVERTPTSIAHPDSVYAREVAKTATKIVSTPVPEAVTLYESDEDLRELAAGFSQPLP